MFKTINGGILPSVGSKYSAGSDLYANEDAIIYAGDTKKIALGVAIDEDMVKLKVLEFIPYGYEARLDEMYDRFMRSHYIDLHPRSSLRAKGIVSNTGIIDMDFTQELQIILHATESLEGRYEIKKGQRIAQVLLLEHKSYLFGIKSDAKRDGGFGSTGA